MLPQLTPMLASASDALPSDEERWSFEFKWDGVRCLAYIEADRSMRLETRNLIDVTARYPELHDLPAALGDDALPCILDGEIVAFGADGVPSFSAIQQRFGVADPREAARRAATNPVTFLVFDVPWIGGLPLVDAPLVERRGRLTALGLAGSRWLVPPSYDGEGTATLAAAESRGLEGVMAKRLESRYEIGRRTGAWRKIKLLRRDEFVVGGWYPGEGRRHGGIGSLLLGRYDEAGALQFCGAVGTGFSDRLLDELLAALSAARRPDSPFAGPVPKKTAVFTDPVMVVEVGYGEVTPQGILRHPRFVAVRHDKDPAQVRTGEPPG